MTENGRGPGRRTRAPRRGGRELAARSPERPRGTARHRLRSVPAGRRRREEHGAEGAETIGRGPGPRCRRRRPTRLRAGGAVKIPSDEVIVGFAAETDLAAAESALGARGDLGVVGVQPLMKNTFVVTISAAADGRAFAVSRDLSLIPGVAYAEPNFVVVMPPRPRRSGPALSCRTSAPRRSSRRARQAPRRCLKRARGRRPARVSGATSPSYPPSRPGTSSSTWSSSRATAP